MFCPVAVLYVAKNVPYVCALAWMTLKIRLFLHFFCQSLCRKRKKCYLCSGLVPVVSSHAKD